MHCYCSIVTLYKWIKTSYIVILAGRISFPSLLPYLSNLLPTYHLSTLILKLSCRNRTGYHRKAIDRAPTQRNIYINMDYSDHFKVWLMGLLISYQQLSSALDHKQNEEFPKFYRIIYRRFTSDALPQPRPIPHSSTNMKGNLTLSQSNIDQNR